MTVKPHHTSTSSTLKRRLETASALWSAVPRSLLNSISSHMTIPNISFVRNLDFGCMPFFSILGQTTMLMFVEGLFILVKPITSSSISSSVESQPYHALNGKISPCGQFYVSLNEDSVNSKVWLEVYRLPVDIWMKEVSPIIQEFQNARTSTLDDEVGSIK
ncbi:unnamed protein product, partial [Trichobilharzia regenti]